MEAAYPSTATYPFQIFAKLLDSKTAVLKFAGPHVTGGELHERISQITRIPIPSLRLISGGFQLTSQSLLSGPEACVHVTLRLRGGKGGFGSLLRGAATKAGQKKTNNFDACRDMSGRRLRHVNAEKRLEEWKAEEEERRLERIAEEFIKKKAKKGKKGAGDGAAEKYVEKYREQSALCAKEVEDAVREACGNGNGKRKLPIEGADAKRLKIWMGKRIMGDSDSEDDEEDGEGNEKSVVLNDANHSDLNKEAEGSMDSVTGGASSESGASEEEKESVTEQGSKSNSSNEVVPAEDAAAVEPMVEPIVVEKAVAESAGGGCVDVAKISGVEPVVSEQESSAGPVSQPMVVLSSVSEDVNAKVQVVEANIASDSNEETVVASVRNADLDTPIDLNEFNSAAELEVLGMERLKTELQSRGLKCGGTLQERAARLFLLKSTPLEKLPKKLLAKK
ncbi:hypothetical protein Tsubulata_013002 [Turnera subulata]|uniref:Sde2 N-terminal ubiquitin domain-containing protein n=1 Tax=Turnera subulata TaxID=218843 RepID=A0A9Q0FBT9_9ROSI|nr:hypothetical protein Tsubulata_013002 [Turnera subulata]